MDKLKDLDLTEKDFQMLIDGLDALPEKGLAGSIMVDLIGAAMMKDKGDLGEFERKRKEEAQKREAEKALLVENLTILKSKLFLMKRHFQENNLLKAANGIINP